jgi:hypothetical protein
MALLKNAESGNRLIEFPEVLLAGKEGYDRTAEGASVAIRVNRGSV